MRKTGCTCVYATARNEPAVRSGHEMGGYVKEVCATCLARAKDYQEYRKAHGCVRCGGSGWLMVNYGESATVDDCPACNEPGPQADITQSARVIEVCHDTNRAIVRFEGLPPEIDATVIFNKAVGKPLTPQQYNAIPELCAIKPSLYESIVRAIERAHGITE